jgi:hypothetical protein
VFSMCPNSAIVVGVNNDVSVQKMKLMEKIHHKFQCHSLRPANIMACNFPIRDQRERMPKSSTIMPIPQKVEALS